MEHIETEAREHKRETGEPMRQYVISRQDFRRLMRELVRRCDFPEEVLERAEYAEAFELNTSAGLKLFVIAWPPLKEKAQR